MLRHIFDKYGDFLNIDISNVNVLTLDFNYEVL
jgi:hypothetical protein